MDRLSSSERIFLGFVVVFFIFLSFATIYPFMYILFASFSDPLLLMQNNGILLYPTGFTFKGYGLIFANPAIWTDYLNSIIYTFFGVIFGLSLSCMAAFMLSRRRSMLVKPFMIFLTITMFFGGGLIPYYVLLLGMNLIDTRVGVILNGLVSVWNIILLRTAFLGVPDSLEESARIDGANDFIILFKILIPVIKPTIAVIVLYIFVGRWNDWFMPMIILKTPTKFPLTLLLRQLLIVNNSSAMAGMAGGGSGFNPSQQQLYGQLLKYCTVIVSIIPILIIYPMLQKHFVKGIMIGSLKG